MIRLLRRYQPGSSGLRVLYWVGITLATLLALFVVFYFLDGILPGGGMF